MILTADAHTLAPLAQIVADHYPAVIEASRFVRQLRLVMGSIDADGRRLAARLLDAVAWATDQILLTRTAGLVAPQLAFIQSVGQRCRDLAIAARRFAAVSRGTARVTLTPQATAILAAIEANDPLRGVVVPTDPVRDALFLIYGTTVA